MEAKEIIKGIKPDRKAYNRTDYLLSVYKDLKNGAEIFEASREVMELIDTAIEKISGDPYIDLIKLIYIEGKNVETVAGITNMDERTIYRHKKRLVKRLAVIFYGDEALID